MKGSRRKSFKSPRFALNHLLFSASLWWTSAHCVPIHQEGSNLNFNHQQTATITSIFLLLVLLLLFIYLMMVPDMYVCHCQRSFSRKCHLERHQSFCPAPQAVHPPLAGHPPVHQAQAQAQDPAHGQAQAPPWIQDDPHDFEPEIEGNPNGAQNDEVIINVDQNDDEDSDRTSSEEEAGEAGFDHSVIIQQGQLDHRSGYNGPLLKIHPLQDIPMDTLFPFSKIQTPVAFRADYTKEEAFAKKRAKQPSYPFSGVGQESVAEWLEKNKVSQTATNDLIKILSQHFHVDLGFANTDLLSKIWQAIPSLHYEHMDLASEFPQVDGPLTLSYAKLLDVLKFLFGDRFYSGHMTFTARKEKDSNGNRIYGNLFAGKWAEYFQSKLPSASCLIPVILYSDQTNVTVIGNRKYHSVYMTIGNIKPELRRKERSWKLLAYLPILEEERFTGTKEEFRETKLRLIHRCFEILLGCLRDLSTKGVFLKDPAGTNRACYPIFAYYICDWPEGKIVTLTLDSNRVAYPCSCCLCPNLCLKKMSELYVIRTPEHMKYILQKYYQARANGGGKKASKEDFLDLASIKPIENFFWSLPGCNIYCQIAPDLLHQLYLGMVPKVLDYFLAYLRSFGTKKEQKMRVKKFDDFFSKFPCYTNMKTFFFGVSDLPSLSADEQKDLLFQLPFATLACDFPQEAVDLSRNLVEWYLLLKREYYSEPILQRIMDLQEKIEKNLEFFEGFCKSNLNLPKTHAASHYALAPVLFESISMMSTEFGEHGHIGLTKNPWRQSNKRNPRAQMVKKVEKSTARASLSNAPFRSLKRDFEENHIGGDPLFRKTLAELLKENQLQIPFLDQLKKALDSFFGVEVNEMMKIEAHNSLWIGADEGQGRIVISHSFHGKPRRDYFSLLNQEGSFWYAQGILLFTCTFNKQSHNLVFVRWLEESDYTDTLDLSIFEESQSCDIVPIETVCELSFMVPHASLPGHVWKNDWYEEFYHK